MKELQDLYQQLDDLIADDRVCDIELYTIEGTLLNQLMNMQNQLAHYIAKNGDLK